MLKKVEVGLDDEPNQKGAFLSLLGGALQGLRFPQGLDRTDVFWILEMPPLSSSVLLWFALLRPGVPPLAAE